MITLAREVRDVSFDDLALLTGISREKLVSIESEEEAPTYDVVKKISQVLKFPLNFFQQVHPIQHVYKIFFRPYCNNLPRFQIRKTFEAEVNVIKIHIEHLLRSVELKPSYPTYDLELQGSPKEVARSLRKHWNLNKIDSLIHLLEENGIIVIPIKNAKENFGTACESFTIFTKYKTPIIFINQFKIDDFYTRLVLAKELGYLVMFAGKDEDRFENLYMIREALNTFATEFLMLWEETEDRMFSPEPEKTPMLLNEIIDIHIKELLYSKQELADLLCLEENELILRYFSFPIELTFEPKPVLDIRKSVNQIQAYLREAQEVSIKPETPSPNKKIITSSPIIDDTTPPDPIVMKTNNC
jgi:Zn-dependent peptidase ImmA (M78 family)/DNA-binding XRE family transcriptional regulator